MRKYADWIVTTKVLNTAVISQSITRQPFVSLVILLKYLGNTLNLSKTLGKRIRFHRLMFFELLLLI